MIRHAATKPVIGMILAFEPSATPSLGGIPGNVIDVWPRFRSGEYLVTLEYEQPVTYQNQFVQQVAVFFSELYQPGMPRTETTPSTL